MVQHVIENSTLPYFSAMFSQEYNCDVENAILASVFLALGDPNRYSMALLSSSMEPGLNNMPLYSFITTSGIPPTFDAITGVLQDMASSIVAGRPSNREGRIYTYEAEYRAGSIDRGKLPVIQILPSTPSFSARSLT